MQLQVNLSRSVKMHEFVIRYSLFWGELGCGDFESVVVNLISVIFVFAL